MIVSYVYKYIKTVIYCLIYTDNSSPRTYNKKKDMNTLKISIICELKMI